MPKPTRRPKPTPEELAREIARRLAESSPIGKRRSIRDSVAIGRLIAGTVMTGTLLALVIAVFASVSWIMGLSPPVEPEVLSANVEGTDSRLSGVGSTTLREHVSQVTASSTAVIEAEVHASAAVTGITVPEPTNPAAPIAVTQRPDGSTTSSPTPSPTTMPPTATTSATRPVTTSTIGSPTTTVVMVTSTTESATTTTEPVTTTTIIGSTTTCGNQGQGKGNC